MWRSGLGNKPAASSPISTTEPFHLGDLVCALPFAGQSLSHWAVAQGTIASEQHSNWPRLQVCFHVYCQVHCKPTKTTLYGLVCFEPSWKDLL